MPIVLPVLETQVDRKDQLAEIGGQLGILADALNIATIVNLNYIASDPLQGVQDGTNTIFTMSNTPVLNTERLFINGIGQVRNRDYTIDSSVVAFALPPIPTDSLTIDYSF